MNNETLIQDMTSRIEGVPPVPPTAEVVAVRQYSLDELEERTKRFLDVTAEAFRLPLHRRESMVEHCRTVVRMPSGARAVVFHASGAIKLVTGISPMKSLFEKVDGQETLIKLVEETTDRLGARAWIGENENLAFERLWRIKAAAADRKGQGVEPVLCRVVGSYRHFVGELPVWGAASVAVKLAAQGALDSVMLQVRETTGEVIDRVDILRPEEAARKIILQMSGLMGQSKIPLSELATIKGLRFGYLSLSKRRMQRVLAPVYIAMIDINFAEESQAYVFVVSATEKTYLPLSLLGKEAPPATSRRAA